MRKIDIFIPLKGESQRVPGKNMRPFSGRPLFHTILATLEEAERVGNVFIDTDSDVIAESIPGGQPGDRTIEIQPPEQQCAVVLEVASNPLPPTPAHLARSQQRSLQ